MITFFGILFTSILSDFKNVSGKRLSTEQIEAVFTSFDVNKDGKLSYHEFKKFMMRNSK